MKHHMIRFEQMDSKETPNYYEYSYIVHKLKKHLVKECGFDFQMYADEETTNEIWEILEEDLREKQEGVQLLSYIYDTIETSTISSTHTTEKLELIIKPRITNGFYFYPKFEVALAQIPIYQNHSEMNHDFIFAKNDECLGNFLQYVLRRKRESIKNHVMVFTDTEDGVDSSKEKITNFVTRDDVFLEEQLKKEIYRSIDEFFSESGGFFKKYQIPYKRGVLLYGKPGNGKTTLVKSIANSITAPVAYWQITEYTTSYSIKEVFSTIAKMAPMALVIEDIDSMPEGVRSVFLNTLDGATSKEGIFLIGTTNYPEKIDPALINRAGRFDRAYEIKLPTVDLRYKYLLKKDMNQFITNDELDQLVSATKGFSFAQLNELYTSIALQWHYEQQVDIHQICSDIQSTNNKSQKQQWDSEDDSQGVGFRF